MALSSFLIHNGFFKIRYKLFSLCLSVEVLLPWDLWGVELWEDWINDKVQDELEWKLGPLVQSKWKSDWVEAGSSGHHNVNIEVQSLVSDEKLLKVYKNSKKSRILSEEVP